MAEHTFKCHSCSLIYNSRKERDNHILVTHGYKLKVYHLKDNETKSTFEQLDKAQKESRVLLVESTNSEIRCPDCPRKYASPATLNVHLQKKHHGFCLSLQPGKRKHDEVDNSDVDTDNSRQPDDSNSLENISSSSASTLTDLPIIMENIRSSASTSTTPSNSMENISSSCASSSTPPPSSIEIISAPSLSTLATPPTLTEDISSSATSTLVTPPISTEKISSSSTSASALARRKLNFIIPLESNYNAIVLKATDCADKSESEKRKTLMMVELLGLKPMILKIDDGEQLHMLMSKEDINALKELESGQYTCTLEIPEQRHE